MGTLAEKSTQRSSVDAPAADAFTEAARGGSHGAAWLDTLARAHNGQLSPEIVGEALRACGNPQLVDQIMRAVAARWGNTGVQQTLAAERAASPPPRASAPSAAGSTTSSPRVAASPLASHQGPDAEGQQASDATAADSSAMHRAALVARLGLVRLQGIESALIPAYRRAIVATDTPAVRALVMQIVGGVAHVVDAQAEINRLVPQVDESPTAVQASTSATDAFEPDAAALHALKLDKAALDAALATTLPALAVQVSPQTFGDQPTGAALEPLQGSHLLERFVTEAELVVSLLREADEIAALATPTDPTRGTSEAASDSARALALERVAHWRSRPVNYWFLVRVLSSRGVWQALQGARSLRGETPDDIARKVATQAAETGATTDVGSWDADRASSALAEDAPAEFVSSGDAMAIFDQLASAEPRARGGLVKQLHRMGLLSRFCEKLPWGLVKQLWETIDDAEAARLLEPYWANQGGGQSLGQMLDKHWYTRALSKLMDVTTLGAKPRIDAAYEAHNAGLTSDEEFWLSIEKSVGRAAFVAAAMAASGGLAGEFAAGAAGGLGETGATIVSHAASGAIGGVGGHLAGDVFDQTLDGKQGFDSLGDYAKSFAVGGAIGTVAAPLALTAAKYLPEAFRTLAQSAAVAHPQLTRLLEAARLCGVGVATRVRMTVREFLDSIGGGGGAPGLRLAYAGGAVPPSIAAAPPSAVVTLTVRPLLDLNQPGALYRDDELVELDDLSLPEQVEEEFAAAQRGLGEIHAAAPDGSFDAETSTLGESAPEVQAIHAKRTARDAGAVASEGDQLSDLHHIFPQQYRDWFAERGIDIDEWCIRVPQVEHQAQHAFQWNDAIMSRLVAIESRYSALRGLPDYRLSPAEILDATADLLRRRELGNYTLVRYRR